MITINQNEIKSTDCKFIQGILQAITRRGKSYTVFRNETGCHDSNNSKRAQ